MREGKPVVVKTADVEVGVSIIDEERFSVEVSEILKDSVDEGMMIADVEFKN